MKRSLASVSALLFTLALLAGCAGRAPAPESQMRGQWSDQQSRLEAMNNWQLTGKVGLRTPEDSVSANLDWWQSPTYYRLLLSGPFGSGRSTLEGNDQGVTLITSEGRFQADTPEALMEEQLGWSLPVSALDYWVRGLPTPDASYQRETDAKGYPLYLQQQGWEIAYRDWVAAGDVWLPRRLVMSQKGLRATLVVNQWRLEPDDE
ncbi:lipoprotein localization protein LolB [Pistricoccus aurantiacus]|uniref:Outer-membrane lipoprotein LolB n=1 Tax=Pistricoccus aurantiacus TaxID=1883414 RepID=A0A5B8SZT0_9GAMM|nr:lipoprotein insertase outer membrane protein LolB [Pistricoccus aurantiacus]QEA40250.1 lipoprotein localization protein LolB [Pistricoccus aurantiacus]